MTIYYVGKGGSDVNNGTTWALRKLTLNGVEDIPVVANDTVYVGPGAYREAFVVDVSGSSGQPITYIADTTGENTDEIGGIVRVTGSDDDQTATRTNVIGSNGKSYRTFRGFMLDYSAGAVVYVVGDPTNWILEDLFVESYSDNRSIIFTGDQSNNIVRRCILLPHANNNPIYMNHTSLVSNSGNSVENCILYGTRGCKSIALDYVAGVTITNCLFFGGYRGVQTLNCSGGTAVNVKNSVFNRVHSPFYSDLLGTLVEDYNSLSAFSTARTLVNTGSNSDTYGAILEPPLLHDGYRFVSWMSGQLSIWSQVKAITGSSESSDDLFGMLRPVTSSKKSRGAIQYDYKEREVTTTYDSSIASIKFADANRHQMFVPVTAVSTTITVRVYRETNYAGTLPQMIIRQPGQSARTTVDVGSASTWNELSDTFTPDGSTDYVIIEFVSNNTAASGSYAVYFDLLNVS